LSAPPTPCGGSFTANGYAEVILPALWEQAPFTAKAGPEVLGQMFAFRDKGGRDVCLIPEATALLQEQYNASWARSWPKPVRVFYVQRCYRYDRPQRGRYREFTQVGVELLGGAAPGDRDEVLDLLRGALDLFTIRYELKEGVQRGLSYYVGDGFEAEVPSLGAQKQLAGGGRYREGIGWALGLDRLLLCLEAAAQDPARAARDAGSGSQPASE
jgi:histidyl-tRNA synthetase